MSSASLRAVAASAEDDGAPDGEVRKLIEALEIFAFQSERILARLDFRAAAQARHVARQLSTIAPFVRLGLDQELREAASLELKAWMAQARVCLGRGAPSLPKLGPAIAVNDTRLPTAEDDPASSVRSRRDHRRDPTRDADVSASGGTVDMPAAPSRSAPATTLEDRYRMATEAEPVYESALRDRTTQPEGVDADAPSTPIESGIRRAPRAPTSDVDEDAAACRQWKSLLGNASTAVRAIDVARSVVTLTAGRRRDPS